MNRRTPLVILAVLLGVSIFALLGVAVSVDDTQWHVTCYQYGILVYENDVEDRSQITEEIATGREVQLPEDCIYLEIKK